MENTHRRPSGKRPKKRRFIGNQFMKVCSHTYVAERKDTNKCASSNKISGIQTSLKSNLVKVSENFKGYRIFDFISTFSSILSVSCCLKCHKPLTINEKSTRGLCSNFEIRYKNCGSVCTFSSCENTGNKNNAPEINRRSILAMRCIGQGLESLKSFCALMSLPNPVEQKSYDVINNKLPRVMKEVAEESMKRAAVEENSSSPENLLTVSGDGTWKTGGHSSLIGKIECVGHVQKRLCTILRKLKLVHSKKKLSDGKTIGGKGRLTDSLIDKLAHYYGNAIRCNSTSVKEMRKAIWAVWGHSCSTDDEPMHWFCPTNPNTWYLSHPALLKKCLGGKTQNPNESINLLIWKFCPKTIGSSLQIAEIAANLATSVFNDGNLILISILEKFGLKINRNVCVSLAERDNRRIFTSKQRRLESSFEARRAKKIKRVKKLSCFRNRKACSWSILACKF
ncbi:uncharacterized protein TNCV_261861 [Trichonephila clavipes]|nr:uncharacterized protein TNCV_261861 [Trichonephila clavipes]